MSTGRPQRERGLFDELRSGLRAAIEGMAGQAPTITADPLPAAPDEATLRWRQPLQSLPGAVWILAAEEDWKAMSRAVLKAAGIEDSDDAELQSTYFEITNQGLAAFAQVLTASLRREVLASGGAISEIETGPAPAPAHWSELSVQVGEVSFTLIVGMEDALLDAIEAVMAPVARAAAADPGGAAALPEGSASAAAAAASPSEGASSSSKTFDLLLEVELPVSVSFGRARVPLKDVLKLTGGSVVEFNRSILEPVEIIVNNCVIARGEVVVIEGNFGVRIQEVVSRQERLRTLQ